MNGVSRLLIIALLTAVLAACGGGGGGGEAAGGGGGGDQAPDGGGGGAGVPDDGDDPGVSGDNGGDGDGSDGGDGDDADDNDSGDGDDNGADGGGSGGDTVGDDDGDSSDDPALQPGSFHAQGFHTGSVITNSDVISALSPIRTMQLYTAAAMRSSGTITHLRFYRQIGGAAQSEAITCFGATVRMAHTSRSDLVAAFADNVEEGKGSVVTVVDNESIVIPAGEAGEYFEIPFSSPFHYNGVDNLAIEFVRSGTCSSTLPLFAIQNVGYVSSVTSPLADAAAGADHDSILAAGVVYEGGEAHRYTNPVFPGTSTAPFTGDRKVQLLYRAAAVGGSGPITGIGMRLGAPVPTEPQLLTITMRMAHSTMDHLASGPFEASYADTPVTVADSVTFRVPGGTTEGELFWLPFTGSFDYNGLDNLIVEIETVDNSQMTEHVHWLIDENTGTAFRLAGDAGAVVGVAADVRYPISFRFHGSTVGRISVGSGPDVTVFPDYVLGRSSQVLYLSSELGTSGTITRMACRMADESSAETEYPRLEVTMSHTDAMALDLAMEGNLDDATVVFDGPFTVPAGLIEGDWIEIPLSTGFDYSGAQNLIVQIRTEGGVAGHACDISFAEDRFAGRFGAGITHDSADAEFLINGQRDIRLWITK